MATLPEMSFLWMEDAPGAGFAQAADGERQVCAAKSKC
jgi:hypothetical protein